MRTYPLMVPQIGLIAGTRMALGVGIGFLLAPRLSDEQRRAAGWALVAVGALTTIPLALQVFGSPTRTPRGVQSPEFAPSDSPVPSI
jgi:hypothetical protein